MEAAVLHKPNAPLVIESVADPSPAPGEILIQVKACGVCRTDVHLAAAGKIKTAARGAPLERINEVFDQMRGGRITGRMVLEFP